MNDTIQAIETGFGVTSMVAPLRRVAMRAPGRALLEADAKVWHYGPTFAPERIAREYQALADRVEAGGAEILWIDPADDGLADSVFTHDPSLMSARGAILLKPGKKLRQGEEDVHGRFYEKIGVPVIGRIEDPGRVEGGDCLWLDDRTLAIGRGFRTNQAGIEQMQALLGEDGVTVKAFDLPVYQGREACLHLMSVVSLVDRDLALVYLPLLPVAFLEALEGHGYRLIEGDIDEFQASGGLTLNVLALAPGQCVMIDGWPKTRKALEAAGCSVETFAGDALCVGCEGGPTCLTRPIWRA